MGILRIFHIGIAVGVVLFQLYNPATGASIFKCGGEAGLWERDAGLWGRDAGLWGRDAGLRGRDAFQRERWCLAHSSALFLE